MRSTAPDSGLGFIACMHVKHEAEKYPSRPALPCLGTCVLSFQVRQLAFKHVETLMTAMDAGQPFPPVCPGESVQLSGLAQAPQYNGQVGLCFALDGDRIAVALRSGKQLMVRHANAVKVAAGDGSPDTTASCSTGTCGPVGGGSCSTGAQGGCEDSAGAPLQLLSGVRSVQVPSMDAEHEQCVAHLNALAQTRNVEALQVQASQGPQPSSVPIFNPGRRG